MSFQFDYSSFNRPRIRFAALPTPLQPLHRFREAMGSDAPHILIKRDDMTGAALGGNKARKLEFLLAEAISTGADTVLTCGAAQSNHALQTAAVAGRYGLKVVCVLDGPEPAKPPSGNMLLHRIIGTRIVWCTLQEGETRKEQARRRTLTEEADAIRSQGGSPFVIPTGGSTAVGSLGYVLAVEEVLLQLRESEFGEISAVYFPSGSGGTQAGLQVGARRSAWTARMAGVDVDYIAPDSSGIRPYHRAVLNLTRETAQAAGMSNADGGFDYEDIELWSEYAGAAYGVSTPGGEEAIHLLASTEGIFLDPVYSGKAFAAMIDHIRQGAFSKNETLLFWHTGGVAGLFAPH